MNIMTSKLPANPVLHIVKMLIGKMRQSPEVYPIKYYKKGKKFRRRWQTPLIK